VKNLAQDVAEEVLGAAKDGRDLAHNVAVDVMAAAKNGSAKVFIVKVLFFHCRGKSRACCIIPPVIPRCPETQSASMFIHTPAPQAAPRVEPQFPFSLWVRVRRDMLARVVTVSGHRGPFETCCWCCRPSDSGGRHVKSGHVKDAAQDGSVKVLIFPIAIFQWRRTG